MASVYFAIAVMLALGVLVGVISYRWAKRHSYLTGASVAVVVIAILFIQPLFIANDVRVVNYLPTANVIIWCNFQPIAGGALIGIAAAILGTPIAQRLVLLVPLALFTIFRTVEPVVGSSPVYKRDVFNRSFVWGQVVRQTTLSSCSAASAATALRYVGIPATEREMSDLCLTHERGTFALGLYRGLKLKTDGTPYRVTPFHGSLESLLALGRSPAVINITVPQSQRDLFPAGHSVVILPSILPGNVEVADPYSGPMPMSFDQLKAVWDGQALRVEKR